MEKIFSRNVIMGRVNIFCIPVYEASIGHESVEQLNQELKPIIEDIRSNKDLANPWFDNTLTSFKPELKGQERHHLKDSPMFIERVEFHVEQYIKSINTNLDLDHKLEWVDSWVNFSTKGHYQHMHVHPNSDISGVYYYQANGESELHFQHPVQLAEFARFPYHYCHTHDNTNYIGYTGGIILFPSWLYHSVLENLSDNERISIAFNIRLK
jgi:uncharacterized protein (TIGR02466 family)